MSANTSNSSLPTPTTTTTTPATTTTTPTTTTSTSTTTPTPNGASTSIRTIFEFIATVSPVMVVFFIIMISVFNQNMKGVVYLGGLLIAMLLNILVVKGIGVEHHPPHTSASCSVFDYPDAGSNRSSSVNSLVLMFTSVYIMAPMFIEEGHVNMSVVISMILFYIIDLSMNIYKKCSTTRGVIIGTFIGLFTGTVWFAIFNASNKNLLFFNELIGDGYYCNKPTKQNFKCDVYKGGELLAKS